MRVRHTPVGAHAPRVYYSERADGQRVYEVRYRRGGRRYYRTIGTDLREAIEVSEDRLARIVYTEIDARGAGAYMANFVGGEHRGAGKIGGSEIDVHHRLKKQPDLRALALFVRAPSSKIDLEETLQNFFALPHAKVKGTDRFAWPFTQQDVLAACEYLTNQGVRFCCASIPEHLRASGSALWALEAA